MPKKTQSATGGSKTNINDVGDIADRSRRVGNDKEVVLTATGGAANVTVQAKLDESADSLLRRFNREIMRAGVMRRLKELEFYEKPSTRKKKEKKMRAQRIKDYERWAE